MRSHLAAGTAGQSCRGAAAPRKAPAGLAAVVAVALALGAAVGSARAAQANPAIEVVFTTGGSVAASLPDGTALGATTGSAPVIPAGYYAVDLSGPGGCILQPLFDLEGPGVSVISDMAGGEATVQVFNVYLRPNSTYSWRTDNVNPGTVWTFATSTNVVGAASGSPTYASSASVSAPGGSASGHASSENAIGSALVTPAPPPYRGTLSGSVSAAGRVALAFRGKAVASLAAGRYTLAVLDRSSRSLVLETASRRAVLRIGAGPAGAQQAATVTLSAGTWLFTTGSAAHTLSVSVR